MKSTAFTDHSSKKAKRQKPFLITSFWFSRGFRSGSLQVIVLGLILGVIAFFISNVQDSLAKQGIKTGFDFLSQESGFEFAQSLIAFSSLDTISKAYLVAVLNTLKVFFFAVVLSTLLGLLIGLARLSENHLLSKGGGLYVEIFRNTPQLVIIIFLYTLILQLPGPREAFSIADTFFLSNRGLVVPWFSADNFFALEIPSLSGLNFSGGYQMSPEFLALWAGLSLYISAFIAEIVRAGVQSVKQGQLEAAKCIGLSKFHINRYIVFPQALRVMIPAASIQYISILKNSSLGVAVGYPELFSINNTIVTLSGQAVEAIAIMMSLYLVLSLFISLVMNFFNNRVQIKER